MAKKPTGITGLITSRPGPPPPPEPAKPDPVKAWGVGLRTSEWERIRAIAKTLDMNPHELAVWALRDFLARYEAGEIPLQTKPSLPKR